MPTPAAFPVEDAMYVDEVSNAEFFAGDLFRRRFGGAPPDYPRHFVAWHRAGRNVYATVGYLHCTVIGDLHLLGGVIEDDRAIARMPAPQQVALRKAGGVIGRLLRDVIVRLEDAPALWAYVGEPRMRSLFADAGFESASVPDLLVRWKPALPIESRTPLQDRALAFGPF